MDLNSLRSNSDREQLVEDCIRKGMDLCEEYDVTFGRRRRGEKKMAGE